MRLPNPFTFSAGAIASALLGAVAHALAQGIVGLAAWALGGLTQAATATTAVRFDTWYQGPWRAMLGVAGLAAVPLFFVGVLSVISRGEGPAGLARLLGRLVAAGVGTVVGLGLVELVLALVDVSCQLVERTSGISLGAALARLGTALGVGGLIGGSAVSAVGAIVLALLAALAALTLWIELAVRSALLLVATVFLPLGLAGLLWPSTSSWLRRLGELIAAVAVSKLVIVVVLVLGAAALTASPISISTPGADIDALVTGVAFLGLATLGLPMAMRVVPMAAEAALHAGRGAAAIKAGVAAPARAQSHVNAASSVLRRVNGSAAGPVAAPAADPRPTPGGPAGNGSAAASGGRS